jgi:uncharacterized MAPEG superfamily protein
MTTDLKILAWVAGLTALMWLPYILARMATAGIMPTLNYTADDSPLPPWAARAKKAHYNEIENLAPFAAVILVAQAAGLASATTAMLATVYLWARIVHYAGYLTNIPFVRTLAFAVGWIVIVWLACIDIGF